MVGWNAFWWHANSPYPSNNNLTLANLLSLSKEGWKVLFFHPFFSCVLSAWILWHAPTDHSRVTSCGQLQNICTLLQRPLLNKNSTRNVNGHWYQMLLCSCRQRYWYRTAVRIWIAQPHGGAVSCHQKIQIKSNQKHGQKSKLLAVCPSAGGWGQVASESVNMLTKVVLVREQLMKLSFKVTHNNAWKRYTDRTSQLMAAFLGQANWTRSYTPGHILSVSRCSYSRRSLYKSTMKACLCNHYTTKLEIQYYIIIIHVVWSPRFYDHFWWTLPQALWPLVRPSLSGTDRVH